MISALLLLVPWTSPLVIESAPDTGYISLSDRRHSQLHVQYVNVSKTNVKLPISSYVFVDNRVTITEANGQPLSTTKQGDEEIYQNLGSKTLTYTIKPGDKVIMNYFELEKVYDFKPGSYKMVLTFSYTGNSKPGVPTVVHYIRSKPISFQVKP